MTLGRRVVNVTQKARGKQPLQYEFEIIPYTAWDIPTEYDRLLFAWERGSKIFVTETEKVRQNGAVFWKQFLKQTVTMYKNSNGFEAKDYSFKLQTVKTRDKGEEERKTVAKIHIDLSIFCTGQINPEPIEKIFQLKPFGKLKVSIRASWLKDSKIEPDAMTEMTTTSTFTDNRGEEEIEDQDLSGFDGGEPSTSKRRSSKSGRHRSSRKGDHGKGKDMGYPDNIPEGTEAYDENEVLNVYQRRERKTTRRKLQPEEDYGTEEADVQGGARVDEDGQIEIGRGTRVQKQSLKDKLVYLLSCSCCAPKEASVQGMDPHEGEELLTPPQKIAIKSTLNVQYK